MFNEDDFKKFQNAAKKGKKVDVSSSPNSKKPTTTAKKPLNHSKQSHDSDIKKTSVTTNGNSGDVFAKEFGTSKNSSSSSTNRETKETMILGIDQQKSNQRKKGKVSKFEQKQQGKNVHELFSQNTFEQILEGDTIPTQPKSTTSNNNREHNFNLKNELKELQKQNDVLLRLLEDERKTTEYLRSANLDLEEKNRSLEYVEGENPQINKEISTAEKENTDTTRTPESQPNIDKEKGRDTEENLGSEDADFLSKSNDIQEALSQLFQLKQENTRLVNEVSIHQSTIKELQEEKDRNDKERNDLQGRVTALLKEHQEKPDPKESTNDKVKPTKQLAKILYSNGCRDMSEQMQLMEQLSRSQHLIDWFRKIHISEPAKFEQLIQQKMFCVREGIDVPLHDALIVRTTNKKCELSEGEELDLYVREFQNGFLINGFRNGHILGAPDKLVPVAQSFLVHHSLQIVWSNRFIPTLRRQIFVFWRQSKTDTPDFITNDVLGLFTEQQKKQFWKENVVQVREALYLTVHATNLALFFRRASKKINDWQPL